MNISEFELIYTILIPIDVVNPGATENPSSSGIGVCFGGWTTARTPISGDNSDT